MALVPYLTESDLAEADRTLLARPINLFRALANSPDALRQHSAFGTWIRHGCELDPRLRELAILQVGYLTASPYEWSHHVKIGHDFGVTDEDVTALVAATEGRGHGLGELETAVLSAAREITTDMRMSEANWAFLEGRLGRARLVDLVIVVSFYSAVVRILGTLQVDVEPEYAGYLEKLPAARPRTGLTRLSRPAHSPALLTAAQRARELPRTLPQPREQAEDLVEQLAARDVAAGWHMRRGRGCPPPSGTRRRAALRHVRDARTRTTRAQTPPQLVVAAQRREHHEVEQAAGAPVQPRPAPHLAPAGRRDVLLHGPGEVAHPGERALDVRLAEHLLADGQASLVALAGATHATPGPAAR